LLYGNLLYGNLLYGNLLYGLYVHRKMKANAEVEISHPQSRLKSVSSKLGGILRPPASELSACVLASIFINLEFEMTASVVWHDITVQSFFETTASVCCVARYNCTVFLRDDSVCLLCGTI